jgi:hypothetical protein
MTVQRLIRRKVRAGCRGFMKSEFGLVTVEWVALAGAVVVGAIFVGWTLLNTLGTSAPVTTEGSIISGCEPSSQSGMKC